MIVAPHSPDRLQKLNAQRSERARRVCCKMIGLMRKRPCGSIRNSFAGSRIVRLLSSACRMSRSWTKPRSVSVVLQAKRISSLVREPRRPMTSRHRTTWSWSGWSCRCRSNRPVIWFRRPDFSFSYGRSPRKAFPCFSFLSSLISQHPSLIPCLTIRSCLCASYSSFRMNSFSSWSCMRRPIACYRRSVLSRLATRCRTLSPVPCQPTDGFHRCGIPSGPWPGRRSGWYSAPLTRHSNRS